MDTYYSNYSNLQVIYDEDMSSTKVYAAYNKETKQDVVLKQIIKEKLLSDYQQEQAIQEFNSSMQFNHPNIVKAYHHFETPGEYVIEMEMINQANYFTDKCIERGMIIKNEIKLKKYMSDICQGLDYLHSQGIIHCDLKLQNFFCSLEEGEIIRNVKLGDFGLIHKVGENGKAYVKQRCGTQAYIAPEMLTGAFIDFKTDIWSLGINLYRMACGYTPNQIKNYKYGSGPIPFHKNDWKKRSIELQNLIIDLLQFDPENRPSVKQILDHSWFQIIDE